MKLDIKSIENSRNMWRIKNILLHDCQRFKSTKKQYGNTTSQNYWNKGKTALLISFFPFNFLFFTLHITFCSHFNAIILFLFIFPSFLPFCSILPLFFSPIFLSLVNLTVTVAFFSSMQSVVSHFFSLVIGVLEMLLNKHSIIS